MHMLGLNNKGGKAVAVTFVTALSQDTVRQKTLKHVGAQCEANRTNGEYAQMLRLKSNIPACFLSKQLADQLQSSPKLTEIKQTIIAKLLLLGWETSSGFS